MAPQIHPTAIIDKNAILDEDVYVGPYSIIGRNVRIGRATRLMSHVVIEGRTEIGENCTIFPFASIGHPPQDLKYKDEDTSVKIGNNNIIREYVSIHRGSVGGDGITEVGNDNFLMDYVHIAHDCKIGSKIIMSNNVGLSGHVHVEDCAVLGGMIGVHQFVRIGGYTMVGGFSRIVQDIPPYVKVSGAEKAKLFGLNIVGLKNRGFSEEVIEELKKAYKILFREKLTLKDAIKKIQSELPYTDEIRHMIEFIQKNKRGICR